MKTYDERIEQARTALSTAEFVVIGAGAGLSDAAGLTYSGKRFHENFADFIAKYQMEDLYSSSFYPFKTAEEKWAYWARHVFVSRYEPEAMPLYRSLHKLISAHDFFVITTNVDHQFRKAGFPDENIFATQGDYGLNQCAAGCHQKTYGNEKSIMDMLRETADCRVPAHLVPKCPVCGGEMDVHLRKDEFFVQDESWYEASSGYDRFLKKAQGKKTVFVELGVGFNTPGIIRFPFEQMIYQNPDALLIRINRNYPEGEAVNAHKTISFSEEMSETLGRL